MSWFHTLFNRRVADKLIELKDEAERHHIDHEIAARHHAALAEMYARRVVWAQEQLNFRGETK
jgi:hypothetical protein